MQYVEQQAVKGLPASEKRYKIILGVILFLPCLLIDPKVNNDIWFLLSSGRYVLNHGIPHTDPLTMHQGLAFVMQQWLSAVIFWFSYSRFGFAGLLAVVAVVYAAVLFVIFKLCLRVSNGNFLTSYGVSLACGILLSIFMVTRPYIFTVLVLALELYLLESYLSTGNYFYLLFLPVLSVAEVNLHSAMWPVLFVFLLPYFVDSFRFRFFFIKGEGYPKKPLIVSAALMAAAGFINPYGIDAMTYLFRSYGYDVINTQISEMRPPNINEATGKLVFGTFLLIALVYVLYRAGKVRLRYALLTLGTAYMTMSSIRSYLFFILCGFFPLACYLKDISLPAPKAAWTEAKSKKMRKCLTWLLSVSIMVLIVLAGVHAGGVSQLPEEAGAIDYIQKNSVGEKVVLFAGYNEGGYAEFKGLKPYMDPRAEVFLKETNHQFDYMDEYVHLLDGTLYYKDFLNKYGFTYVLAYTKKGILFTSLKHDADYRMVYKDEYYCVYKRVA